MGLDLKAVLASIFDLTFLTAWTAYGFIISIFLISDHYLFLYCKFKRVVLTLIEYSHFTFFTRIITLLITRRSKSYCTLCYIEQLVRLKNCSFENRRAK